MAAAQRNGPGGGQTQVQNSSTARTTTAPRQAVLHLRGAVRDGEEAEAEAEGSNGRTSRHIQWSEDVVDNEGMGKKSSKVCCIYHAPKGIDESSDESSSDGDSDSDAGDDGSARPMRGAGRGHGRGHHGHDHGKGKGGGRERSPNAYEKIPKPKGGGGTEEKS